MYHRFDNTGRAVPKKLPELNALYVFHTSADIKFRKKAQPEYRYMSNGILLTAAEGTAYTYTRTVTIGGVKKGLTLVSLEHRKTVVEKFFKESIDRIKKEQELEDKFKSAMLSPIQVGLSLT